MAAADQGEGARIISGNQIGNNAFINQGTITNYHYASEASASTATPPPPPRACIRVIPYPRNTGVVERSALRRELEEQLLPEGQEHGAVALWGLGGSGKTQIALEYAYRRFDPEKCSVFWVHADSRATLMQDYKKIAVELGLDKALDGEELLRVVRGEIKRQPMWVLVVDNADDLQLFGVNSDDGASGSLYDYIPRSQNGTVLWTSRDKTIGNIVGVGRALAVGEMTPKESSTLLTAGLSRDIQQGIQGSPEDVDILCETLYWLPLPISQAAAFMTNTSTPVKQYLALLKQSKHRAQLLRKNAQHDRHRRKQEASNSIFATWEISIQQLGRENPVAYRIMHVLAFLDNQDIPIDLISVASGVENDPDSVMIVKQAVGRLVAFSFLGRRQTDDGEESYEMHKLVQEAARDALSMSNRVPHSWWVWLNPRFTISVAARWPWIRQGDSFFRVAFGKSSALIWHDHWYRTLALRALTRLIEGEDRDGATSTGKYVVHAIQVATWAKKCGWLRRTASMLGEIAAYLFNNARYVESLSLWTRVVLLYERSFGKQHRRTLESRQKHARVLWNLDRPKQAFVAIEKVYKLQIESLGQDDPDTLETASIMAEIMAKIGRRSEATELLRTTLEQQRSTLGDVDMDTLQTVLKLSNMYGDQSLYEEAHTLVQSSLGSARVNYGDNSEITMDLEKELALIYLCQGRREESYDMFAALLAKSLQVCKKNSMRPIELKFHTAVAMYANGLKDDAINLMKESHAEHLRHRGANGWKTRLCAAKLEMWTRESEESDNDADGEKRSPLFRYA